MDKPKPPSPVNASDPSARAPLELRRRPTPARRLQSSELFGPEHGIEVEIEHGDAVYRLRRTSLGKLILTK